MMSSNVLHLPSDRFLEELEKGLTHSGYAIFPDLFNLEFTAAVRSEMEALREAGEFRPAGVGLGNSNRIASDTRGDGTYWFSLGALSPVQAGLAGVLESVRQRLNETLFLGLWDWEGHYAIYPEGAFYRQHLDRFAGDSKRTVSVVFFFNTDWMPEYGGSLRLDLSGSPLEVSPLAGTAVFFLSDRIPHEVLETKRDRFSFAGWLRTRST